LTSNNKKMYSYYYYTLSFPFYFIVDTSRINIFNMENCKI